MLEIVEVARLEGAWCPYGLQVVNTDGNGSCQDVAVSHCFSHEKWPCENHHELFETSLQDSATERYPVKQETEVLKALRAQLMLQGVVCTLGVGGTVEEQDVVTTASKSGQHRGVFDRITGQLLDLVGVEIPRGR